TKMGFSSRACRRRSSASAGCAIIRPSCKSNRGEPMAWRDSIEYWRKRVAPIAGAAVLLALAVALILFVPPRGAAASLGVLAGALLGYTLKSQARYPVQMAVLWACAAVTADAA